MNKEDTTALIWDYLYMVRIPYIQSKSEEELRRYGVRLSEDKRFNDGIMGELLKTYLSIDQMIELYKKDVPIRVVNYSDTKAIYEAISKHIEAWKFMLERGINIGDAPIEDLIAMDEFANLVYDHARHQFTRDDVELLLAKQLSFVQKINANNFLTGVTSQQLVSPDIASGKVTINQLEDYSTPDRDQTLGDFFKSRIINIGNR